MQLKWIATAAFALALTPGVALAQSKTSSERSKTTSAKQTAITTRTTSTGDVSSASSEVTPAMLKAQDDPNLIGSPAWWKTHATADGKPLNSRTHNGKPE